MSNHPVKIEDIIKNISENQDFKTVMQTVCKNMTEGNDNDIIKKENEDYISILNMYFLDENGNNLCDILNKINNNISNLNNKIDNLTKNK